MVRALAALLDLAVTALGGESLRYATSWEEAVEEARALHLPLVVHRHGFY